MSASASIIRQPARYRVEVGKGQFIEVSLAQARLLRDACDKLLRAEGSVAELAVEIIATHFNATSAQLRTRARHHRMAHPRLIAMALISEFLPSWQDSCIAELFGFERSTVPYSRKWVSDRESTEPKFRAEMSTLRSRIQSAMEQQP